MPNKRGRPQLSYDDAETTKELRRLRNQRYYQNQRQYPPVTRVEPRLQIGETIISLMFDDENAAQTLDALGLRTQGLTLPQDPSNTQLRSDTIPINEHYDLYSSHLTANSPQPVEHTIINTSVRSTLPDASSRVTSFFPTLPPRHPFYPLLPASTPSGQVPNLNRPLPTAPFPPYYPPSLQYTTTQGSEDLLGIQDSEEEWEPLDNNGEWDDVHGEEDDITAHCNGIAKDRSFREITTVSDNLVSADEQASREAEHPTAVGRSSTEIAAPLNDGEEESTYDFPSEGSPSADDDDEADPVSLVAQKLFDHLQFGFRGCSAQQHHNRRQHHDEAVHGQHHSLGEIFNDPTFPSVLALHDMISPERLSRQAVPTPVQWQSAFCGVPAPPSPQTLPVHVCLHSEPTQAVTPQVAFDVDSFLGFTNSLGFARKGLWYQPTPQIRQNMTNDVHLDTTMFTAGDDPDQLPQAHRAMLRDVPHFLLGRVEGAHDITVHVLFPHLGHDSDKFISLTHHDYTRWFDHAFHPAVYHHCAAHYAQHLPASFRQAFANSKARQVEGRQIETMSYQSQQALGYHLQPELLDRIWQEVLVVTRDTPGLMDLRDPQLFFSAKGTKLQFKSSEHGPTLLDVMDKFDTYFADVLDLDRVDLDRTFVDVGKEMCPGVSLLADEAAGVDEQPQVYMWKRCCLEEHVKQIYDGTPPAFDGNGQRYYDQSMLREASAVTSVPPKSSTLHQGGIRYFQVYNSVKEVWDAAKSMPFANEGLEEMALDPTIRQGARHLTGGRSRDAKVIERAYCASKRRAHFALTDSRQKSFGVREEYRISWSLYCALKTRLRWYPREELEVSLSDCPEYVWPVQTERYLNFLWRSVDKFATGFEVVRARCRSDLVTWEQTKMMAMFLRCLRFVLGGHQLSRESALWWSRREREVVGAARPRVWYGLGFCNTLPRYGYCWLEPRMDWSQLTFQPTVTDHVLFGNNMLRGRYLQQGRRVRDFFDATKDLELALVWMEQHRDHVEIRDRLIYWIVHLCLRQFRMDVLGSIPSEIVEEHRKDALAGLQPFCYEYFEEIMVDGVYLTAGNRTDFKEASSMGHYLFYLDDGRKRQHWEVKPYRQLYRRARTGLRARFGHESETYLAFRRRFWRSLFAYHWILPQPSPYVFLQMTKQNQRMWYSISTSETGVVQLLEPKQWQWARKDWQIGRPPPLPAFLTWGREAWEQWIEQAQGHYEQSERS